MPPSLKVWILSLTTVLVLLVLFVYYSFYLFSKPNHISSTYKESLEMELKKLHEDSAEIKIVFFGSSLSFFAFPNTAMMEQELQLKTGKSVNILKVNIFYLNLGKMINSEFLTFVEKYPPDFLFLESNRLTLNDIWGGDNQLTLDTTLLKMKKGAVPIEFGFAMEEMTSAIKSTIGIKPIIDNNCNPSAHKSFFSEQFDFSLYHHLMMNKTFVKKASENFLLNKSIVHLKKVGTRIFFIEFPRFASYDSVFLNDSQRLEWKMLMTRYDKKYGVPCISSNVRYHLNDFFDGAHLNKNGARKFDSWFVSKFDFIL